MKDFTALIRDTRTSKNPVGTWQNAKNIILTKGHGSVANEDGLKFQYLVNGTIIGIIPTNNHVVYLHKNEEGIDEIGVVNTNNDAPVYKTIIKDNQLNFQLNCPIEGIFIYNYKEDLIISWCDGVKSNSNPPRVLNTTTLPFDVNPDGTLVDPTKFNIINITPSLHQGNLNVDYTDFGSLGGYAAYITFSYVYNDDSNAGYFPASDIGYLGIGVDPTIQKGLRLNFTDLDPSFTRLRIGLVIRTEPEGETASSLIGYEGEIISYNGTSLDVDITSLSNYTSTAVETILIEQAYFTKANTITKVGNQAFLGNVETNKEFKFQKYANLINIVPVEYIDEADDFYDNNKGQDASFMPDEVYAFYIELQLLDGSYTPAYHIPGRAAEGTERNVLTAGQKTQYDLDWTDSETGIKQFHILNNGVVASMAKPEIGNLNTAPVDESGNKFGYWENVETYPNDDEYDSTEDYNSVALGGEDLRGTPIRYHRFPSITSMYEGTLGSDGNPIVNLWANVWGLQDTVTTSHRRRRLGIKITNIADVIPASILNQIQGYRISHVSRNSGNSYVAGNWIATRRKDVDDGRTLVNSDGLWENYDFNTYPADAPNNIDFERVRVLGNELFKFRPSLSPRFIQVNYSRYITNNDIPSSGFIGYEAGTGVSDLERYSKCYSPLIYRPGNSLANNTDHHEEGINLNLKPNLWTRTTLDFDSVDGGVLATPYPYLQYFVLNLTAYNNTINVYTGFKSDKLNIVARTSTIANNTVLKGGDNFTETELKINVRSRIYSMIAPSNPNYNQVRRSIAIYLKGLNSSVNVSQLYNDTPEDIDETDTAVLDLYDYDFDVKGKEGISSIQNVLTIFTFDIDNDFINKFPFRIYKGLKIPNENLSINALSTYLVGDYYEMPNDKGEIIALRGKERALFIQHRFTLFVAAIKDTLKTRDTDTYLGSSDLFDRLPEELLSDSKGYIGSTSKFACIIVKGMYITVNQVNGQIFIIKEDVKEISNKGNKNWFWNNWDNGLDFYDYDVTGEKRRIDNPFISVGHLVGYDKEYNRLLFIKKMYKFIGSEIGTTFDGEFYTREGNKLEFTDTNEFQDLSKTLSFNLESGKMAWICEHDYHPNLIYYTSNGLYSLTNKLNGSDRASNYEHNDKLTKGLFYGTKYASYIDLIFNKYSEISKLLMNITWITDVVNNNGGNEREKTITHIMIYNNHQCSGIINLKDNHFNLTRNIEGDWNFNDFRDLVINPNNPIIDDNGDVITSNLNLLTLWFEKSNFISKFIVVRLMIDNIDNDTVYINEVNIQSEISNK